MAKYSVRSGVENHPEATYLQLFTDFVVRGGVITLHRETLLTGDYQVVESSGGLNVDVLSGRGYVKNVEARQIRNTATDNIEIDANGSGNPRITTIIALVDLSIEPASEGGGDDIHLLLSVNGTPASSPVAPTNEQIQSAIGAANPWIRLADVLVPSGATGIPQNQITDRRSRVFMRTPRTLETVPFSGSFTPDFQRGDIMMTLADNITINAPSNMGENDKLIIRLIQDSTPREVVFGANLNTKSADMTMPANSGQTATYLIHKISATSFDVYLVGKDY